MTQPATGDIDKTSDGKYYYSINSKDAARFGGNKPSDYIDRNICARQDHHTDVDNGAGGRLKTDFSGDWNFCKAIVQVAKDWESNSVGSWWLYHDIIIYGRDDKNDEKARLQIYGGG